MCLQNSKCPVAAGNNKCFLFREGLAWHLHSPIPIEEKWASKFKTGCLKNLSIYNKYKYIFQVFYGLRKVHDKNSFVLKLNALA